jgi:hypothetical protein
MVWRTAPLALCALLVGCGTAAGEGRRPAAPAAAAPLALWVAPTGSDSAPCTQQAPCLTVNRANLLAQPGQAIQLEAGTYPAQEIDAAGRNAGPNAVVRPAPGASVSFSGRLTLAGASFLTLDGLQLAQAGPGDRSLFFDACNRNITVKDVTGTTFLILEGNDHIHFVGGSWGGYGTPTEQDSAIGTAGAAGPTRMCNGQIAAPAHDVVFDRVTFHDVFWNVPEDQWGGSHPDCFEINGYADGVVIRDSRFLRCASTFMQINPNQGDITNLTITGNTMEGLGPDSWYGLQINGDGNPGRCGNVVFTHNTYVPETAQANTWPNSPILTACVTVDGMKPLLVTRNLFVRGPPDNECARYLAQPFTTSWSDNVFLDSPCGDKPLDVVFGYSFAGIGLVPQQPAAGSVRQAFALAARGLPAAAVARRLVRARLAAPAGGWTAASVAALLDDPVYAGGVYGAPGTNPALVAPAVWRQAQHGS